MRSQLVYARHVQQQNIRANLLRMYTVDQAAILAHVLCAQSDFELLQLSNGSYLRAKADDILATFHVPSTSGTLYANRHL